MDVDGTGRRKLAVGQDPVWSPDGLRIAFIGLLHRNGDRLNRTGVSPDGSRIAFGSSHDGDHEIYVVNADGTGQTQLTDNTFFADSDPVWLPG